MAKSDKNSPIKLQERGIPIFARVKNKKIEEYKGIVVVTPL